MATNIGDTGASALGVVNHLSTTFAGSGRTPQRMVSVEIPIHNKTARRKNAQTLKETRALTSTLRSHMYRGHGECSCCNLYFCCHTFVDPRGEQRCVQSCLGGSLDVHRVLRFCGGRTGVLGRRILFIEGLCSCRADPLLNAKTGTGFSFTLRATSALFN